MSKHTPGPWVVVDGHYSCFKEVSGLSFKISAVMWASDLTDADYDKRSADLNLIAAAPDLLAALQNIANYNSQTHPDSRDQAQILDENARIARAAIAKATGET